MSPPRLVGFSNYARLISDARLAVVYKNTALFAVTAVILTVGIGTLLGVAVNKRLPAFLKYILRTAYFFPVLVGMIYAAMVWKFLFNRDLGVVNYYLHFFQRAADPLVDQQRLGDLVGDFRVCLEKRRFHDVNDACRATKHFGRTVRSGKD